MNIILSILAVFAITLVMSQYSGLGHVFTRMRNKSPEWLSELLSCFVCLSWYIALPFAIIFGMNVLEYLAVVGGAITIYLLATK